MSMRNEIDLLKVKIDKFSNEDIANSIADAQSQLNHSNIKQKDLVFLQAVAQQTKNQSEWAAKQANEIFNNASNIYETLKQSDQLIVDGKKKMLDAAALKPLIEEHLNSNSLLVQQLNTKIYDLNGQIKRSMLIAAESTKLMKQANSVCYFIMFL